MAKHDYYCESCDRTEEHTCLMAEATSQTCSRCGGPVAQQFSPPTVFYTPERFKHSFSELYGTTSEKDFLKENPNAVRVNQSTFKTRRQQDESRWAKANKEAADIEGALKANKTLRGTTGAKKRKRSAA